MKFSQESIILILATLLLAGIVIWKKRSETTTLSPAAPVPDPDPAAMAAPVYTSYNFANAAQGYGFGPPVINTLPQQTMGIVGAVATMAGCKTCH